jgi:hypothetical protein
MRTVGEITVQVWFWMRQTGGRLHVAALCDNGDGVVRILRTWTFDGPPPVNGGSPSTIPLAA